MTETRTIETTAGNSVPPNDIKRGVSLYSFQEEHFLRKMMLEDCVATAAKLDIPGIEIIGDQVIRGYPNPPDSFFQQWRGWRRIGVPRPMGSADRARQFYGDLLGLEELPLPPTLSHIDLAWYRLGDDELHLFAGEDGSNSASIFASNSTISRCSAAVSKGPASPLGPNRQS